MIKQTAEKAMSEFAAYDLLDSVPILKKVIIEGDERSEVENLKFRRCLTFLIVDKKVKFDYTCKAMFSLHLTRRSANR